MRACPSVHTCVHVGVCARESVCLGVRVPLFLLRLARNKSYAYSISLTATGNPGVTLRMYTVTSVPLVRSKGSNYLRQG